MGPSLIGFSKRAELYASTTLFGKGQEAAIQGKRQVSGLGYDGTGGSVKAEGLGDGLTCAEDAIAKLRLTLPPISWAALRLPWAEFIRDRRTGF